MSSLATTDCTVGQVRMSNWSWLVQSVAELDQGYASAHPALSVALCVLGVVLNSANLAVLTRPCMLNSVAILLSAIALCDLTVMLSNVVLVAHFSIVSSSRCVVSDFSYAWALAALIHAHLSVVCHSVSVWLTVVLAHVRVHSLRNAARSPSHALVAPRRALAIVAVFLLATCLCNLANFFTFRIEAMPRVCNESVNIADDGVRMDAVVQYLPKPVASCALMQIAFWINGIVFKVLPCFMLTIFILLLLRILSEVNKRKRRIALSAQQKETVRQSLSRSLKSSIKTQQLPSSDHTTRMLVAVLAIFLITELPQGALSVMTGIFDRSFHQKIYVPLGDLMDLLSLINSSVNFVIYCTMSRKFRQVFCDMFVPRWVYLKLFAQPFDKQTFRAMGGTSIALAAPITRGEDGAHLNAAALADSPVQPLLQPNLAALTCNEILVQMYEQQQQQFILNTTDL